MSKYININKQIYEKNYSLVGRISLQKYPILLQIDKIIKGSQKKHRIKDLFTPDDPKKDDKIDEFDTLFNKYQLTINENKNHHKKKKSKLEFCCKLMKNNPKLLYHNKHCYSGNIKKKLTIESDTFSYAPKYDYIKPRLLSGPCWKNSKGRKAKKSNIDIRNYYINKLDFFKHSDSKCLVNMRNTTKRGNFLSGNNFNRLKSEKSFNIKKIKNNINSNENTKKTLFINLSSKNKIKSNISETTRNKNNKNNKDSILNKPTDRFSKTYSNFNIKLKHKKNLLEEEKSNKESNLSNNKCDKLNKTETINNNISNTINIKNSAPDFSKIISREQVEKAKGEQFYQIPFIVPNYSLVRERPLAMTIYKKRKKEKKTLRTKYMGEIDYKIKYDPDKIIDKCNNHVNIQGPNFNYMLSRDYSQKNSLPSYMRDIYDRGSVYRITEKALKLNKYKEGKMANATSSFLPKRSFNKIININMINSHDFKETIKDEYINEKKKVLKTEIERKNNEDQIEHLKDLGLLTQFENFTYKSIPIERKKYNENKKNNKNWIHHSLRNLLSIA